MKTKRNILNKLKELNLGHLNSRPYDCSYSLLEVPKDEKKLIIIGFNGSLADDKWTNTAAIEHAFQNPDFFNVEDSAKGN